MTEQQQALQDLRQQEFAAMDAAMYLDAHPLDEAALQYFRVMQQQTKQAQEMYHKHFGVLNHAQAGHGKRWDWIDEPWPWEGRE